jgi:hypothetical protein
MEDAREIVSTSGLALPAVGGLQLAFYADRRPSGFWPAGAWRDRWGEGPAVVRTLGLDIAGVRLRLVVEELRPGASWDWGLV